LLSLKKYALRKVKKNFPRTEALGDFLYAFSGLKNIIKRNFVAAKYYGVARMWKQGAYKILDFIKKDKKKN